MALLRWLGNVIIFLAMPVVYIVTLMIITVTSLLATRNFKETSEAVAMARSELLD